MRTRVGYTGGSTPNPTYSDLCCGRCDHTESIQIDYDPKKVKYTELLDTFWSSHHVTGYESSRQYMSAIWYKSDKQKAKIEKIEIGTRTKNWER